MVAGEKWKVDGGFFGFVFGFLEWRHIAYLEIHPVKREQ